MMASISQKTIDIVDKAVGEYYERLNVKNYFNKKGIGKFKQYLIDQDLTDDSVPIKDELGCNACSNDCSYTEFDPDIPVPNSIDLEISNKNNKNIYIFWLLQYCYLNNQSPSTKGMYCILYLYVYKRVLSCFVLDV